MKTRSLDIKGEVIEEAYRKCADAAKNASSSFYISFQHLPKIKRDAIYSIYVFCRLCDDAVDDPAQKDEASRRLDDLSVALNEAYKGNATDWYWIALNDTRRRFGLNFGCLSDVIEGCRMDIRGTRYETFEDLVVYCRRVASSVGIACLEVFGYEDERAPGYAIDLGIGMQLTNIIRDLAEDTPEGRLYIPLEDMERFSYSEKDLANNLVNENLRSLVRFQLERAKDYLQKGKRLLPLLDRNSRLCSESMAVNYGYLLRRVEAENYDVLNNKIRLRKWDKFKLAMSFLIKRRIGKIGYRDV